ncbi:MAG: ATP-binding protein, partial [Thermodesulfobacteriota bacterium]|nr:ATP-binding protein [Thermodesulfobacteriota bacterium]
TLTCETDEEVAGTCLAVAEKLTSSQFGSIDEVNDSGRLNAIALSDPGWDECKMPRSDAVHLLKDIEIRGLWGKVFRHEKSVIINDPSSHPDRVGTPEGHPVIMCFLGVPLKYADKTIGVIGLANKESGYDVADQQAIETLSVAFVEALNRKRAEEELKKHRENLEDMVEKRTAKLEEVNAELESFAYSISHDLRAPLRAMQGFSQALLEDCYDELDARGKEYARRIDASALRMETLIQDLLNYSRLSRSEIELKPVNLDSVVDNILKQLDTEIQNKDALITVDRPLPEAAGHKATLEQIVENLITNALKFVPFKEQSNIHIWAEESGEMVHLWVEDNGIGIGPEHHERIFCIFERLHGIERYPGTGVGLAIVKKGIEKLGGRVGVESTPGKGSKFWVELGSIHS